MFQRLALRRAECICCEYGDFMPQLCECLGEFVNRLRRAPVRICGSEIGGNLQDPHTTLPSRFRMWMWVTCRVSANLRVRNRRTLVDDLWVAFELLGRARQSPWYTTHQKIATRGFLIAALMIASLAWNSRMTVWCGTRIASRSAPLAASTIDLYSCP